jgi:hypothetical protein
VLRVFFGNTDGYSPTRVEERELVPGVEKVTVAGKLTVADLNGDGRPDIVVTPSGTAADVYWNRFWLGRGNFSSWPRTPLAAKQPVASAVGDFNRDGLLDLLLAGPESLVFWGSATRTFVTLPPSPLADVAKPPLSAAELPAGRLPVPRQVPGAEHIVLHREAGRYSAFPALYHIGGANESLHVFFGAGETTSHVESRKQPHDFVWTAGGRGGARQNVNRIQRGVRLQAGLLTPRRMAGATFRRRSAALSRRRDMKFEMRPMAASRIARDVFFG